MESSSAAMPSVPPFSVPTPPPTERALRRLLASRKPEDQAALQDWLAAAPDEAVSRLTPFAALAVNQCCALKVYAQLAALTVLGFVFMNRLMQYSGFLSPFITLITIANCTVKSGSRSVNCNAVLLLARSSDARAVLYLADLWTPRPLTRREAAFNANVTRELTRLLSERHGDRYDPATETALRRLVARAFPGGRMARAWRRVRPAGERSEADTDLLLAVVRHITYDQPQKAGAWPLADEATLRWVTDGPAVGTHGELLRDTTQILLGRTGKQTP